MKMPAGRLLSLGKQNPEEAADNANKYHAGERADCGNAQNCDGGAQQRSDAVGRNPSVQPRAQVTRNRLAPARSGSLSEEKVHAESYPDTDKASAGSANPVPAVHSSSMPYFFNFR
jgi:hypothetical protein